MLRVLRNSPIGTSQDGYDLSPARAVHRAPRKRPVAVARLFSNTALLLTVVFAAQSILASAPPVGTQSVKAENIGLRSTQEPLSDPAPEHTIVPLQLGSGAALVPEESRPEPPGREMAPVQPGPLLGTPAMSAAIDLPGPLVLPLEAGKDPTLEPGDWMSFAERDGDNVSEPPVSVGTNLQSQPIDTAQTLLPVDPPGRLSLWTDDAESTTGSLQTPTARDEPAPQSRGQPERLPVGTGAPVAPVFAPETVDPVKAPQVLRSSAGADRLVSQALDLIQNGDISAARLVLERAMSSGNARAILHLAETYDPRVLAKLRVRGIKGDSERSRELYRRAFDFGVLEAQGRLTELY